MSATQNARPTDGEDQAAIGARLALTRTVLGMSQKDFAQRAGLNTPTYNQYETGTNMPKIAYAIRLCDAHNLTLDWIFRGDVSGLPYRLGAAIKAARTARIDSE